MRLTNSRSQVLASMRRAGNVLRYHTMPTIKKQTVADHTWNVMRIYVELFGPPDNPQVWQYMLYHDALEIQTGDSPFYAKRRWAGLKMALAEAENQSCRDMGVAIPDIGDRERGLVKVADLAEMWEWGYEECLMGNKLANIITADTEFALSQITEVLGVTELVRGWMDNGKLH